MSVSLFTLYLSQDYKKEIKSRDRCKGRQSVGRERLLAVISPTRWRRVGRCYRKLGGETANVAWDPLQSPHETHASRRRCSYCPWSRGVYGHKVAPASDNDWKWRSVTCGDEQTDGVSLTFFDSACAHCVTSRVLSDAHAPIRSVLHHD